MDLVNIHDYLRCKYTKIYKKIFNVCEKNNVFFAKKSFEVLKILKKKACQIAEKTPTPDVTNVRVEVLDVKATYPRSEMSKSTGSGEDDRE